MRVFNACLKIIRARLIMLLGFLVAFAGLGLLIAQMNGGQFTGGFEDLSPTFTVISRDDNAIIADGLREYLARFGEENPLPDDPEILQDATFYEASDYIVFVPEGFTENLVSKSSLPLERVGVLNNPESHYADMLTNQYVSAVSAYLSAGVGVGVGVGLPDDPQEHHLSIQKAVASALDELNHTAVIETKNFTDTENLSGRFIIYMQFSTYTLSILVILCVSAILTTFRKNEMTMRNGAAPISGGRITFELSLAGLMMGLVCWAVVCGVGLAGYRGELAGLAAWQIVLPVVNMLVFTLVALGLGVMAGASVSDFALANGAANMISLVLSFLGGVFVPFDMLGKAMQKAAQFTPSYWNLQALQAVADMPAFDRPGLTDFLVPVGMQLAFAATFFCVALALSKIIQPKASPTITEIEM